MYIRGSDVKFCNRFKLKPEIQMSNSPSYYRADYYYVHPTHGTRTRSQQSGSIWTHLEGATTETAVVNYLRRLHPGYEIVLMSVEWE